MSVLLLFIAIFIPVMGLSIICGNISIKAKNKRVESFTRFIPEMSDDEIDRHIDRHQNLTCSQKAMILSGGLDCLMALHGEKIRRMKGCP